MKEQTIRLGKLSGILQRAEVIKENEEIVELEFDPRVNIVTLYTAKRKENNNGRNGLLRKT